MFEINRIIDTDSYKSSHFLQYPPNTTLVHSYLESRGSERNYTETVFFGLQYLLKRYFAERFTMKDVLEANEVITAHGEPFNLAGWTRLIEKHHGTLPLRVRAVAEGSIVPTRNVLMTVENTDDEFFWLTGWFESQLMRLWYPITVSTQSYYIKRDVYQFLSETADDADAEIGFKVHDFGSRGVSSQETAAIGGAAHLVNFMGTDTMSALLIHRNFYHSEMAGFSIPACYDDKTEILTNKGFKLFADLTDNDLVAQYKDDETISFISPEKIHSYDWNENLIRFESNSSDLCVTPNHKIVRFSHAKNKLEIVEAKDGGYSHRNSLIVSGFSEKENESLSMLDRLRIAFQADGSFPSRKDSYNGLRFGLKPIRFTLKKERKKERLEWILNSLGFEYTRNESESRKGYSHFWVKSTEEFSKQFDWVQLNEVSSLWAYEFLEECSYWDGRSPTENTLRYDTTVKFNADIIQALAVLCGIRSSIYEYVDQRENRKPNYSVNLLKETTKLGGQYTKKSEISYQGKVYCVTVPSGMILVRRNGFVCVSGNSEHSTITSWGRENEIEAYRNMLKQFAKPNALVAVVSDSWNIYEAVEKIWGEQLKQEVIDSGATIVIRPDSGEPVEVVGKVAEILAAKFGTTTNSKGYKVLKNVRIIQGDGVNPVSIHNICQSLKDKGFSISNIAFGIGGALLQKIDRDTMKFAYKCSAIVRDGKLVDVYKEPITDTGKSSKKGRLDLIKDENGDYQTVVLPEITTIAAENSQLKTVFENGQVLVDDSLEAIRQRAW
jgi:nicotinic acid phosphoribosyltransferase